ncbi:MAG: PIN domain-containing protein [Eubacterium sp.]|nr:PIN domain-containing protein [Eubacterium sp.]
MLRNDHLLDANAVLRFLLQDIEEQFQQVKNAVRMDKCYVTLEVMAEVCYVLEGLYQVSRKDIVDNFRRLNFDVVILNADVFLRALEIFDEPPKLDFVDCLLYGYEMERGVDVITFDKKLKKKLKK